MNTLYNNTLYTAKNLVRRPTHIKLDEMPIHIGDVVHLQLADGPTIRATVIFNAPIDGTITYTTELLTCGAATQKKAMQRIRFRYEHVHRIEPVRVSRH